MNRIQMFYSDDLVALQLTINDWLSEHREIEILDTNISSLGKPSQRAGVISSERHIFYILYRSANTAIEAPHELTAEAPREMLQELTPAVEQAIAPNPEIPAPLNETNAGSR